MASVYIGIRCGVLDKEGFYQFGRGKIILGRYNHLDIPIAASFADNHLDSYNFLELAAKILPLPEPIYEETQLLKPFRPLIQWEDVRCNSNMENINAFLEVYPLIDKWGLIRADSIPKRNRNTGS